MNIHNNFTFNNFIILFIIFLTINLFIQIVKKDKIKMFLNYKILMLALAFTLVGILHSEMRHSGDWLVTSYGFPRDFYYKRELNKPVGFILFGTVGFNIFNFIQNITLYYLALLPFNNIFKNEN